MAPRKELSGLDVLGTLTVDGHAAWHDGNLTPGDFAYRTGATFTGTVDAPSLRVNGTAVWTADNDGSGSGLNADFLDGDHGSAFAKLSGATFTAGVTATGFTGPGGGLTGVNAATLGGQSLSALARLSGAVFTGNVDVRVASNAALRVTSAAEDVVVFGLYDEQGHVSQNLELRYDCAGQVGSLWHDGDQRMSFGGGDTEVTGVLRVTENLQTQGAIHFNNTALVAHVHPGPIVPDLTAETNVDHVWHDDVNNTWHMVSDAPYRAAGNSTVEAGVFKGSGASRLSQLGVGGATPDAANPFTFYGENLLLNSGAGINLKFNKSGAGDDASLTFQQGFSTHALIGLLANNNLTFKVGSSYTTALVIDNATGEVSMPATPAAKFFINRSGRVYLNVDERWITPHDALYGPAYYHHVESGGTGANPAIEWNPMGEYVRAGTVAHDLSIFGRVPDSHNIADVEVCVVYVYPVFPDRWNGEAGTGIDHDNEVSGTTLWRGMWKAGTTTVGTALTAYSGSVAGQIRRKLELNFTAPADGQLRVYFRPLNTNPRPNSATGSMIQSHSWCLSYA